MQGELSRVPSNVCRRSVVLATMLSGAFVLRRASAADPPKTGGSAAPPDVGLYCDPTLAPVMHELGMLFKARNQAPVAVFSASPVQMLALIEHDAKDDVLMTLSDAMDDAVRRKLVKSETRFNGWRNRLVLAARAGDMSPVSASRPRLVNTFARERPDCCDRSDSRCGFRWTGRA